MTTYSSYAGCDIKCVLSIPGSGVLEWASVQTLTISSARTVVQVRGLGSPRPLGITRGARTYAGSLVFATLNKDQLTETLKKTGGWFYDELPLFHIVITGANEYGESINQAIYNVALTNWGTTYSVDDLMTEQTYTYIATDVTPVEQGHIWSPTEIQDTAAEAAILAMAGLPTH